MVKRAPVEVTYAGTVHPGKYLVLVGGDVACVEESFAAGLALAGEQATPATLREAVAHSSDVAMIVFGGTVGVGAIAAANALSDLYAMGARPLFALNVVGFPSGRLPLRVLERILQGAADKAAEAGIEIPFPQQDLHVITMPPSS